MIRQFAIATVLGTGLAACGVGADEDLASMGLALERPAVVTQGTQDPIPPPQFEGGLRAVRGGSPAPGGRGDEVSGTPDPIPPKIIPAEKGRNPTVQTHLRLLRQR